VPALLEQRDEWAKEEHLRRIGDVDPHPHDSPA
jgi:hypothetical protein